MSSPKLVAGLLRSVTLWSGKKKLSEKHQRDLWANKTEAKKKQGAWRFPSRNCKEQNSLCR